MSYPNAIEICRAELFTKEVELRERYPQALVDKVLRVREMYNWFIANPDGTDLLILDDFGIHPFDAAARSSLMDIIEDRHGRRATIITSQVPVCDWHDVIGERTIADAILDRIVHRAIRIELSGESIRKLQNKIK